MGIFVILPLFGLFFTCLAINDPPCYKEFLDRASVLTTASDDVNLVAEQSPSLIRLRRQIEDDIDIDYSGNITRVLDYFRRGYDRRLRPNYRSKPVEVGVTLFITDISRVSEASMDITLDFYFRQFWHDHRLGFSALWGEEINIGGQNMVELWRPDTFFVNEKFATFHHATALNTFLRIDPGGNITQSIRLTMTTSCPMNFVYFPMDSQRCSLEIESYGYTIRDVTYHWVKNQQRKTFNFHEQVHQLPQFLITGYRLSEANVGRVTTKLHSRLIVDIYLERRLGYYVIQVYLPSALIVGISLISLWISRDSPPARVSLGITTVLTMTTLISSTNAALPKISYLKAIDVYLVSCFFMVFAVLLEYAAVSYAGKQCRMRFNSRPVVQDGQMSVALSSILVDNGEEYESEECDWCRIVRTKASDIEKYSRMLFPTLFACFNVVYWIAYLNASFFVHEDGFVKA